MEELDPLLHQPLRTQLVAFLAGAGEQTFSDLKRQLNVSDGLAALQNYVLALQRLLPISRNADPVAEPGLPRLAS